MEKLRPIFISGDFCCLLITFVNSLDQDLNRQNVRPDLNSKHLTLLVFLKDFFEEKNNWRKKSADGKKSMKITQHAKC